MVLVTGGTGLIGSHLIRQLVESGERVRAIFRPKSTRSLVKDIEDRVEWFEADITDVITLADAFKDITHVYHCAGTVSFNPSKKNEMFEVNVDGTSNIVNFCLSHNIKKLIHISSIAAMGRHGNNITINEEESWSKSKYDTQYALSKYLGEMEAWRGVVEGLDTVIVNPSIVLGTGNWSRDSSIIFKKVFNGLIIYPLGTTGFVDVEDVASVMIQLMKSEHINKRFVINSENWTYKKLFNSIAVEMNKRGPFIPANYILRELGWRVMVAINLIWKKGFVFSKESIRLTSMNFYYDNSKILKETGFHFKPLADTIKQTSANFLKAEDNKRH